MPDPWKNVAWAKNVEALQVELIALVDKARRLGASFEYLVISEDGEDTLEAVGLEIAPPDGYPEGGGVYARFFPDLDLACEGGPMPDDVYDSYFPEEKRTQ